MTPTAGDDAAPAEAIKIAQRARRDLEAFADEWNGLTERKRHLEQQEAQLRRELEGQQNAAQRLKGVVEAVLALERRETPPASASTHGIDHAFDQTLARLEILQVDLGDEVDHHRLADLAVAALHPAFREAISQWEPWSDPTFLVSSLVRLQTILGSHAPPTLDALTLHPAPDAARPSSRSTTPYESMMYTLWLPKIRSLIINEWDVHDPSSLVSLVAAWKEVLPGFVYTHVVDQLIVQKLSTAVTEWNPRLASRHRDRGLPPHIWLFPWLPYLDEHHTNPVSPTGLLSDVKRKFRVVLDTWNLTRGVVDGLQHWKEVLRGELDKVLIRHLLPRLAQHLHTSFHIDPADQLLAPLEQVLRWKDFFRPTAMAQLLVAEFFPKWLSTLYVWLTSAPNYEEVGEWLGWWKMQIPEEISQVRVVGEQWDKGLAMINQALDLGDRARTDLPVPVTETIPPPLHTAPAPREPVPVAPAAQPAAEETTFKDVVEEWCAAEDLLLVPLREAHQQHGLPLFRLTASADARGGVLVYMKGDVVWAQKKTDRSLWEPVALDEHLIRRAEGR